MPVGTSPDIMSLVKADAQWRQRFHNLAPRLAHGLLRMPLGTQAGLPWVARDLKDRLYSDLSFPSHGESALCLGILELKRYKN